MVKIIDKIKAAEAGEEPYYAFEFFPPRTVEGVQNLYSRAERLALQKPLYVDITWGAGGTTSDLTMEIANKLQNEIGMEVNMHLTCTNMPVEKIDEALENAKKAGIQNILALRGDPPKGQETWTATEGGFSCALDLVKYIRLKHGNYFGISVAGYPEGHPNVIKKIPEGTELTPSEKTRVVNLEDGDYVCFDSDYDKELDYLKSKIDDGADFIVTQMFFDTDVFLQFVEDCREKGITCPIMPGLMLVQSYAGFKRMISFCKCRVPQAVLSQLEAVKDDDARVKETGIAVGSAMCRQLMAEEYKGLHLYTLNLEKVTYGVLKDLGLFKPIPGYNEMAE